MVCATSTAEAAVSSNELKCINIENPYLTLLYVDDQSDIHMLKKYKEREDYKGQETH